MRRSVLSALMAFALLGAWSLSLAQDAAKKADQESSEALKPVVVVSFAGFDQAMKAVKTVDKLGDGTLTAKVEAALESQVGARDIPGVDPKRPWGIVVQTDGQQFPAVAFIPVTDLKKALAALEPFLGKPREASKDVLELQVRNQSVYVAQKGGWAIISPNPEYLESAPKDPIKILDGLDKSYNLAVHVLVNNVPPLFRQMFLGLIQMGMQQGAERQPGESDEQHAMRTKVAKQAMQQFGTLLNEMENLLVGIKLDDESSSAQLDFQVTAVAGTKLAKQLSADNEAKSRFGGFLIPNAAFALDVASKVADTDLAQAKTTLASMRGSALKELDKQELPEADKKQAKQMVSDLFDIVQKTLEAGRMDAGIAVLANPQSLAVVAGATLADTAKLDSIIRQLIPHLRKEAPALAEKVKLNADTFEGITFHTAAIPTGLLDEAGPKLAEMVGDNLDLVIGIGPEHVYLAAGRNAAGALRDAIRKSKAEAGKTAPPMRMCVTMTPIAKTVAAHGRREDVRESAGKAVKVLGALPGKDHITATQIPVANGQRYQIVIESGVLKLMALSPTLVPGEE